MKILLGLIITMCLFLLPINNSFAESRSQILLDNTAQELLVKKIYQFFEQTFIKNCTIKRIDPYLTRLDEKNSILVASILINRTNPPQEVDIYFHINHGHFIDINKLDIVRHYDLDQLRRKFGNIDSKLISQK